MYQDQLLSTKTSQQYFTPPPKQSTILGASQSHCRGCGGAERTSPDALLASTHAQSCARFVDEA